MLSSLDENISRPFQLYVERKAAKGVTHAELVRDAILHSWCAFVLALFAYAAYGLPELSDLVERWVAFVMVVALVLVSFGDYLRWSAESSRAASAKLDWDDNFERKSQLLWVSRVARYRNFRLGFIVVAALNYMTGIEAFINGDIDVADATIAIMASVYVYRAYLERSRPVRPSKAI